MSHFGPRKQKTLDSFLDLARNPAPLDSMRPWTYFPLDLHVRSIPQKGQGGESPLNADLPGGMRDLNKVLMKTLNAVFT